MSNQVKAEKATYKETFYQDKDKDCQAGVNLIEYTKFKQLYQKKDKSLQRQVFEVLSQLLSKLEFLR